ncbi:MAG TPA: cache domain-containing protein [Leptospiraceae bacterium]|nr:cache domain-containing protein [Leptospiraceae bacterium]
MRTHGKIKQKLLLVNLSAALFILLLGGTVQFLILKHITENKIKQDLSELTEVSHNLVKTAVDSSVSNYLRALAEKNKSLLEYYYGLSRAGILSEPDAYLRAKNEFLDPGYGKVGVTGYLAGVNSKGVIVIHPKSEGVDASKAPFMQKALKIEEGYLEYKWKNTGETEERDKAAYLTYFKPWDLKVRVSSYKEEFYSLVDMQNLKTHLSTVTVGGKGHIIIITYDGKTVFHPGQKNGAEELNLQGLTEQISQLSSSSEGSIEYRNKGDSADGKIHMAFYKKMPEMKWIIVASAPVDDLFSTVYTMRNTILLNMIVITLVLGGALTWSSHYITNPISKLMNAIIRIGAGERNLEVRPESKDEIGELALRFNQMSSTIQQNMDKIEEQNRKILEQNEFLEERVLERTQELQNTLTLVQELKLQQDADYYLTTLLMHPLFRDRNRSCCVKTDFLISQKKKFEFRKFREELGGDLCVTGNLNFSGVKNTLFFNGDAMGKSMQGAGGAIVMGSILNSIMARSAAGKKVLTMSPEEWVHETFSEIQRVFEAFDGSMFVSCVLGLVSEDGSVLYFNAEHPYTVLLRDRKAQFIEEEISVRKLGMPDQNELVLTRLKLEKGDMLIAGSDGRDDLKIQNDDGESSIHHRPELFLNIVEEADGDLKEIQKKLTSIGELTDDLSLIKIFYEGKPTGEKENFLSSSEITELIRNRKYTEAIYEIQKHPERNGFILTYYHGYCCMQKGQYSEALFFFEKAKEMNPDSFQIYFGLAKSYFQMEKFREAEQCAENVLRIKPDHLKAGRLSKMIREKILSE